ncbi:hypothetical protein SNEBB_008180 [Seison nebaliae]|nr:hypothetical protein SNEBB_008180 [Seison nebaliae]
MNKFDIHGRLIISATTFYDYICVICYEVPTCLLETPCHHKICHWCFKSILFSGFSTCPMCRGGFNRGRKLPEVLDTQYTSLLIAKALVCYRCQYATYDGLKSFDHNHECKNGIELKCPWKDYCGSPFFTSNHELAQHIILKHLDERSKNQKTECPFCAKVFKNLPRHIYQRHNELDLMLGIYDNSVR